MNHINDIHPAINRSEVARELGVSKQFVNLVSNKKRKLSDEKQALFDRLCQEIRDSLKPLNAPNRPKH